jgi:hypothetical protein
VVGFPIHLSIGNLLIRITGTGITQADAEAYLQAMDLAAVEKAFGSA